jgi:hypothetical protein
MNLKNSKGSLTKKHSLSWHGSIILFALLCLPFSAAAENRISAFVAHIELRGDGSAVVQEEIVFDFGDTASHGIYREIPLIFPSDDSYVERTAEIADLSVSDGRGNNLEVSYNTKGNLATVKIGSEDVMVSGSRLYVVRYTIHGAVAPTLLKERFYWNITGHEWKVPIDRVRADIVLPHSFSPETLTYSCVRGDQKSNTTCAVAIPQEFDGGKVRMLRFEDADLLRYEGMIVTVDLPKGYVVYPRRVGDVSEDTFTRGVVKWWTRPFVDISLAVPFFVFAGMYSIWLSTVRRSKKKTLKKNTRVRHFSLSDREVYLLSGFVLCGLSFFIPTGNLGVFLSGLILFSFAWLFPPRL